jgi:hypothetical protein
MAEKLLELAFAIVSAEEAQPKPRGYTYTKTLLVDGLVVLDFINGESHCPLFSIDIYNDGADEVYVSINNYSKDVVLKPHESLKIDLRAPLIKRIYIDIDHGKKAYIRIFGIY